MCYSTFTSMGLGRCHSVTAVSDERVGRRQGHGPSGRPGGIDAKFLSDPRAVWGNCLIDGCAEDCDDCRMMTTTNIAPWPAPTTPEPRVGPAKRRRHYWIDVVLGRTDRCRCGCRVFRRNGTSHVELMRHVCRRLRYVRPIGSGVRALRAGDTSLARCGSGLLLRSHRPRHFPFADAGR